MKRDDDDDDQNNSEDCCPENAIDLPPVSLHMNINRTRQRTITSYSEMYDVENSGSNTSDHHEGNGKWGDAPEKNNELECDEYILYVQRNARMTFAGIIEKKLLNEDYLQKLVRRDIRLLENEISLNNSFIFF
jgi:hypothetical protein